MCEVQENSKRNIASTIFVKGEGRTGFSGVDKEDEEVGNTQEVLLLADILPVMVLRREESESEITFVKLYLQIGRVE